MIHFAFSLMCHQSGEMNEVFRKIKEATDKEAGELFSGKILPMFVDHNRGTFQTLLMFPRFPPIFHEWFIETFPEPSTWLTSRLTYSRTAAVMSMVGFILG